MMQLITGYSKRSRCEAREKSTSRGVFTDTLSEPIKRNEADGPSSTACCSPSFIFSVPVVLPHQTLLMTQALRTSAATMFRR